MLKKKIETCRYTFFQYTQAVLTTISWSKTDEKSSRNHNTLYFCVFSVKTPSIFYAYDARESMLSNKKYVDS